MANVKPNHTVTGKVRLSYAHLLEPHKNPLDDENAKPKYSVQLLIPKADRVTKAKIDAAIKAACENALETGKLKKGTPIDRLPNPVHDGDGYKSDGYTEYGPEAKGCWVLAASSIDKPKIVDLNRDVIIDPMEIYSGMYARVGLDFYVYSNRKVGVGCGLGNIQKVADGDPLGGSRVSVDDDFDDGYEDDPLA